MRLVAMAGLGAVMLLGCGCGESESRSGSPGPAAPARQTEVVQQIATCLSRAGATIVRSPADLGFAKGTSLYGDAPSAGTDVVSVSDGRAAVSFMPDEGAWRIYTLSALARGMDPDYEHIWAQLFDDPEALEVVAFTKDNKRRRPTQRCMNIAFTDAELR